jgi:hypothetical protein
MNDSPYRSMDGSLLLKVRDDLGGSTMNRWIVPIIVCN